jgi:outer membrane protein OmpA-like peptidoglycan-associated protein
MKIVRFLALCAAWAALPAFAQTAAQMSAPAVMKEDQVTQQALIDALAPPAAAPAAATPQTRGFRIVRDEPPPPPRQPAKASVLITFETNSAQLTQNARRALDVVAQALASNRLDGQRFVVEGHADPRGSSDANLALSRERAESVRRYLSLKGVDPVRLQAVGKGDHELLNPADPAAPENRRVTFVTVAK